MNLKARNEERHLLRATATPTRGTSRAPGASSRASASRRRDCAGESVARVERVRNPGHCRAHPGCAALNPGYAGVLCALARGARRRCRPAARIDRPQPRRAPAPIDPATAARILALDCERLAGADVREVLAHAPAPRIILLQGSVPS